MNKSIHPTEYLKSLFKSKTEYCNTHDDNYKHDATDTVDDDDCS